MSEFDDPQMERLLGRASGAYPDVNTAYSRVQGRVRVIRRRRAVMATTAACVLLAGGALFAAGRGTPGRTNLSPADSSTALDTTMPESTLPSSVPTSNDSNGVTSTTAPGGSGGTAVTTTTQPGATTTAPAAPVTKQYVSIGGTITVKLQNGALSLVSSTPTAGFSIDSVTDRADRVEVRFRSDDHDSRIRIDLVAGLMVDQIIEN